MRQAQRFAMLAAAALLLAAGQAQSGAADTAFDRAFGERFLDEYWQHNTGAAIGEGYYKYADRLNIPDARTRAAELAFVERSLKRLKAIDPLTLDARHRTDWALVRNRLELLRWAQLDLRDWQWNPAIYNLAEPFALLLSTNYAPRDERLRAIAKRLRRVPDYYRAARASIRTPTREHVQLGALQNRGALDVFGEDLELAVAGSGLSAAERAQFFRRINAARQAVSGYVAWLDALDGKLAAGGGRDFRLGPALYEQKFRNTIRSSTSAQQLYARALAEKQALHGRMEKYADQLWPRVFPDEDPPADRLERIGRVIGKLSEQHVAREGYVDEVRQTIPALEKWVTDHQLIDLDPARPLAVRETPRYMRGVAGASISAPGPYNPTATTYYNVTPLDDYTPEQAESYLREYNHWIMQVLNIHEAVPGHYVQLLYSNRSPSRIKSLFGNGAMVEGWAVYSERMMLESGWGDHSPEMWLMYSKWNLRSVCNTILDYSVHVLGMAEADALKLLMGEAFQSEAEARGKWRRVQLSSVQLTSYFAGFAEIYELREQLRAQQGAAFDLKRFHETLLSFGSAPVGEIKELMMPSSSASPPAPR